MKTKKKLPDMSSWTHGKIAEFWEKHSADEFEDELEEIELDVEKPIKEQVTFRLDHNDVEQLKVIAKDMGIGHTTLIRMWVKEKLKRSDAN